MASIRKVIEVEAPIEKVWAALADFQNVHTRLAPGFVTDSKPEGDIRVVTFANGSVAREKLVTMDETLHRVVYAIVDGRPTHHSASVDLVAEGAGRTRFVWTTDVLPDALAPYIDGQMSEAVKLMKPALER
jgi:carbon monoxide dehydrogenase subunit G